MLNSVRSKQVIIITAMLALVGFLFTREVKGLVKPKEDAKPVAAVTNTPSFSINEASAIGMTSLSTTLAKDITALESTYKNASGSEQLIQAKQLAQKWDDVEQPIPSAMYLEVVANEEPGLTNWLAAGTRFLKAFDNTRDSLAKPIMLQKANTAFTKAMGLDSTNTEAKTGLGVTIVNGMGAPMEGIAMLLDVVKTEPNNVKANTNLGLFAIKSGQYDKAITRFNTMISNGNVTPEIYFYLGTAYEFLGKNTEAIDAYLNSKKIAASSTISTFVDKKVAELKNKR